MIKKIAGAVLGMSYIGAIIYSFSSGHIIIFLVMMICGIIGLGIYGAMIYEKPSLPSRPERDKPSVSAQPAWRTDCPRRVFMMAA
jgi:MFS family permease